MDLVGQLSNPSVPLCRVLAVAVPDGSAAGVPTHREPVRIRRLGDVRDAMVAVLEEGDEPLLVAEIYERVVERLGDPVPSYDHVKDYLSHRSRGERQLFVREGYGRYRLLDALIKRDSREDAG